MTDLKEEIRDLIRKASKLRVYASFWEWPDKSVKERGIVYDLLTSMDRDGFKRYRKIRSVRDEWPDCVVDDESGRLVAVEVTELVNEEAVRREQQGELVYPCWTDNDIIQQVTRILLRKEQRSSHGGLYTKVVLVMHTDEPELTGSRLFPIITSAQFPRLRNINRGFHYRFL